MKAMILAAGKGTRVRPLTFDLPKPMIPILGKPVMEYLVEHLAKYGVDEIMVNVSHLHKKIEEYFSDGQRFGIQIGYSFEGHTNDEGEVVPLPMGSAGGIKKIQDFGGFFDDTTIVLCGDALIDLDLHSALYEHKQKGALASVITKEVPWERVSDYGVVIADKDGRVVSFQEKPAQKDARSNLASTGIYIFEPQVLDLIPSNTQFDIGSDLFPLLVKKDLPFYAQKRFFNWIDIGNITDFWAILQRVLMGEVAEMDVPGKQIREGLWVGPNTSIDWNDTTIKGPVYLGSGVRIEAGCKIVGPAWIGHGSHIGAGSELERSVLFEYTRISPKVRLNEMIVFNNYSVSRDGKMHHVSDYAPHIWSDARERRRTVRMTRKDPDEPFLTRKIPGYPTADIHPAKMGNPAGA
jgi:mannose-1-phosphate guanylyltransferase